MIEYPKSLYRGSVEDHVIVKTKDAEDEKRAQGYEMYADIHARMLNPVTIEATEIEVKEPAKRGRPKAT
jgi:hypothetical protein